MFTASAFSKRLQKLRADKGCSRADMASEIGIPLSSIGNYERGDKIPNAEIIAKLCEYYRVPADYLLCLTDQTVIREWPPAVPTGAASYIESLKKTTEAMLSDSFHSPYGSDALRYYVEIFEMLREIDAIVVDETQKMAQKYPGFISFGRLDAIEIDGVGLREALIQRKKGALDYVAAYDNALGAIQGRIAEVGANISHLIKGKISQVVTSGAIVSYTEDRPYAPTDEELKHVGVPEDDNNK